jgi:hypothetical protein
MMAVLNRWEPLCFLQGRSGRGGLFWVLFWAVAKEYLARGARTAMPNEITTVNAIHQTQEKTKIVENIRVLRQRLKEIAEQDYSAYTYASPLSGLT